MPILAIYGTADFMKREPLDQLVKAGHPKNTKVHSVSRASHHIFLDNPEEVLTHLLESY